MYFLSREKMGKFMEQYIASKRNFVRGGIGWLPVQGLGAHNLGYYNTNEYGKEQPEDYFGTLIHGRLYCLGWQTLAGRPGIFDRLFPVPRTKYGRIDRRHP